MLVHRDSLLGNLALMMGCLSLIALSASDSYGRAAGPCYGGSFDHLGRPTTCGGDCTNGPIVGCELISEHVPFQPDIKYCDCGTVGLADPVEVMPAVINTGSSGGNIGFTGDVEIASVLFPLTQTGTLTHRTSIVAASGDRVARLMPGQGGTTLSFGGVSGSIGEVLYIESEHGNRFSISLLDLQGDPGSSDLLQQALGGSDGALSFSIGVGSSLYDDIVAGTGFSDVDTDVNAGIVATTVVPEPTALALLLAAGLFGRTRFSRRA